MKEVIGADFTIHPCLANALRQSASHSKTNRNLSIPDKNHHKIDSWCDRH